jgi:hypothetical protein
MKLAHIVEGSTMIYIKIKFSESTFDLTTRFAGSMEEAIDYYVGKVFNVGITVDHMVECVAVELVQPV